MADRFFVSEPVVGPAAVLAGAEAHHLIHVLRATPGLEVTLFDGSGAEFAARVTRLGRSDVELSIVERREPDRELAVRVTLGVALPKQDRQRWLVEKVVELGVGRVVPLTARRAVAQPSPEALNRLQRVVIEASKQCGRNRLMEIAPGQTPAEFFPAFTARLEFAGWLIPVECHSRRPWHSHKPPRRPRATRWKSRKRFAIAQRISPANQSPPSEISLAVGPEGGFTSDEVAAAGSHGWQMVDLGNRIPCVIEACRGFWLPSPGY